MQNSYQVLYEDADLLAVNKPAGVIVNRADTHSGLTIQDWFQSYWLKSDSSEDWQDLVPADFDAQYGSPEEIGQSRQGLVHRLDKDTSGVLLLAKNPGSLVNLLAQFKHRQVKKVYQCLVHGHLQVPTGSIQVPLARSSRDRKKFAVVAQGKMAITDYQVEQTFGGQHLIDHLTQLRITDKQNKQLDPLSKKLLNNKNLKMYQPGFSLVACWLKTGRTHQIRVHLKHLGHALVGDQVYAGKKRAKIDHIWCPRQFLHAAKLTITQPRTKQSITIMAPLPEDLQQVLKVLK